MAGKKSQRQAAIDKTPADREVALNALRAKIAELRESLKHLTVEKGEPHSRVTFAERAKIIRLHQKGFSAVAISGVTGRNRRTVSSVIQRYRESFSTN